MLFQNLQIMHLYTCYRYRFNHSMNQFLNIQQNNIIKQYKKKITDGFVSLVCKK